MEVVGADAGVSRLCGSMTECWCFPVCAEAAPAAHAAVAAERGPRGRGRRLPGQHGPEAVLRDEHRGLAGGEDERRRSWRIIIMIIVIINIIIVININININNNIFIIIMTMILVPTGA
jgi:hypothetical protein